MSKERKQIKIQETTKATKKTDKLILSKKPKTLKEFAMVLYNSESFDNLADIKARIEEDSIGLNFSKTVLIRYFIYYLHPKTKNYKSEYCDEFYTYENTLSEIFGVSHVYMRKVITEFKNLGIIHRSGNTGGRKKSNAWHFGSKEDCKFCNKSKEQKQKEFITYKVDIELPKTTEECNNIVDSIFNEEYIYKELNNSTLVDFYRECISNIFSVEYNGDLKNDDLSYVETKNIKLNSDEVIEYIVYKLYPIAKKYKELNTKQIYISKSVGYKTTNKEKEMV